MKRKIKVFLSGVINSTNAQNLNCRALMQHLDPEKFEVRALTVYSGNLGVENGCRCRRSYFIRYPARIWHPIQLVRGILWSDVAYLCKPEHWKLQRFVCWLFRKRAFKTIEGAYIGTNLEKALAMNGTIEGERAFLEFTGHTYSITQTMRGINERVLGLRTEETVLYLGVESALFANDIARARLTDVVMIGSNLYYKGIEDYFELAKRFPNLTFHIVGSGLEKIDPAAEIKRRGMSNMIAHGSLTHLELAELLKKIQLHVFPSRSEGFGKVTFETAAAGVPSVVYDDYGADEWITSPAIGQIERGVCEKGDYSGFVVKTLAQMEAVVAYLLAHPERLQDFADGAREMARRFDWKVLVKEWERVIEGLAR